MPPVRANLNPRGAADTNVITYPLAGIRRLHVFMVPSKDTRRETSDVWWTLSAYATLADPATDLPGLTNLSQVNLSPSALAVPPLGAGLMHIATAFWPAEPVAASLSVTFVTAADQPQGRAIALGYADTAPHDFFGLFRAPFGYPQAAARLVEPLPYDADPDEIRRLMLGDRMPPRAAPLPLKPSRRT